MKVLLLTWEFPPFISGGMGMACYGLIKALLSMGVEVDLVLPTTEDVYFPLRSVGDTETLPMDYLDPTQKNKPLPSRELALVERLRLVGLPVFPDSYATPALRQGFDKTMEEVIRSLQRGLARDLDSVRLSLESGGEIFKKSQVFAGRLAQYARRLQCDVIHVHDWLTYPAGILLKVLMGRPLVAHMHATEFDRAGGVGDERIHHIEYAGLAAADRVIAVSQYTAQMIIDRYRTDPGKIRVVHNAFSISKMSEKKQRIFKEPLVLFLGRITLQKGPDYFVEVAKRVLAHRSDVRFVVAGSGDMFSKIIKGTAARRLKDRVLFTGFLNRDQVEEILTSTDIFVLPSVSEPFGIVPLEAMAYGAVAIISKQSGVSEVIHNAYRVDFWDIEKTAEIILDLLKDPKKRKEMARLGQEEVMKIEWDQAAKKMIQVYQQLTCST
ncbi:MAG: hypothetical protein A2053_02980 [Deltaproteobacteria bacterium GWA2_50_8]|nr:MAG: hypothetical protein A2053_02980 [Deltaproteobacteria bacterium GWA2_50_8]